MVSLNLIFWTWIIDIKCVVNRMDLQCLVQRGMEYDIIEILDNENDDRGKCSGPVIIIIMIWFHFNI